LIRPASTARMVQRRAAIQNACLCPVEQNLWGFRQSSGAKRPARTRGIAVSCTTAWDQCDELALDYFCGLRNRGRKGRVRRGSSSFSETLRSVSRTIIGTITSFVGRLAAFTLNGTPGWNDASSRWMQRLRFPRRCACHPRPEPSADLAPLVPANAFWNVGDSRGFVRRRQLMSPIFRRNVSRPRQGTLAHAETLVRMCLSRTNHGQTASHTSGEI
jgi:hypothetical protein